MRDHRDLVIEELADSEAALREERGALVDLLVDVSFENCCLRQLWKWEHLQRVYGDAALRRLQRRPRVWRKRPKSDA